MKKILVVMLLLVTFASAQEPIRFRGAFIGEPLSDFVDCSSGKIKVLREGYKSRGKLCDSGNGSVAKLKSHSSLFRGVTFNGDVIGFVDSKVVAIMIFVPNEDWDKVRYDITEKMGAPVTEIPEVFQNGFGARWEFNKGLWVKENTVVAAGIKVDSLGGQAMTNPLTGRIDTEGIQIRITDAQHAKLPSTQPSTLD